MNKLSGLIIVIAICCLSCGGSNGKPSNEVNANNIDGATGVSVTALFKYTFTAPIKATTGTTNTYFLHPTSAVSALSVKNAYDETKCDSESAVAASVNCSSTSCTLDPTNNLEYDTNYTICLTDEILYSDDDPFEGFTAQFTTAAEGEDPTKINITAAKLVRLDGTELDFSAKPIPQRIKIKYTLSSAPADETEGQSIEDAIVLKDSEDETVTGTWTWSTDNLTATFTPSKNLDLQTIYTVSIDESSMPDISTLLALDYSSLTFTTMTPRDVNGDGYSDIIIGAESYTDGIDDFLGQAYLFYGSASGIGNCDFSDTCSADATFTGENAYDYLGNSVHIAGDVNADGYADLLIAAYAYPNGDSNGRVYVFHGSSNGIDSCDFADTACTPDAILTGKTNGDEFGFSVSTAGDVNGDGYDDIVVGADERAPGAAYVFLGSTTGIGDCDLSGSCTQLDATLENSAGNNQFGYSVSSAGDVNDDGYDDIIIGDTSEDSNGTNTGALFIFHGSQNGLSDCDVGGGSCTASSTILGGSDDGGLGWSVAGVGDIDGDGYDDVVGSGYTIENDKGHAYVFTGGENGIGNYDLKSDPAPIQITGNNDNDYLGSSIYGAGDVDGDGLDDLILSAPGANSNAGAAYIFLGDPSLTGNLTPATDASATISGKKDGDQMGEDKAVTTLGDIDNDGYSDIAVGSYNYDENDTGAVYIFHGSSGGINNCDISSNTSCIDATIVGESEAQMSIVR